MYYLLDTDLNFVSTLEGYQSVIWATRYFTSGDFEFYIPATTEMLNLIKEDYYITRDDDFTQGMIIEKIQITTDIEEGNYIIVTGRSLKSILNRRIIWTQTVVDGSVETCIRQLIDENAINPIMPQRKINKLVLGAELGVSETMSAQYTGKNLGETIESICKKYGLGYDILLDLEEKQFIFILFKGVDRSYNQTENNYVTFSNDFENLLKTDYTYDKSEHKNVALVAGEGEGKSRKRLDVINGDNIKIYNLVTNGDFENGVTNWTSSTTFSNATGQGVNGSNAVKITMVNNNKYRYILSNEFDLPLNHIVYVAGYCKRTTDDTVRIGVLSEDDDELMLSHTDFGKNKYVKLSYYGKNTIYDGLKWCAAIYSNAGTVTVGAVTYWDNVYAVDLTAAFGAGNEPSKEWCDEHIPFFTDVINPYAPTDLQRYEVYVDSRDTSSDTEEEITEDDYYKLLEENGIEALTDTAIIETLDGEMETNHTYTFNVDYFLGDIVQVINEYGKEMTPRIIEVIENEDESGKTTVVTFATDEQEE